VKQGLKAIQGWGHHIPLENCGTGRLPRLFKVEKLVHRTEEQSTEGSIKKMAVGGEKQAGTNRWSGKRKSSQTIKKGSNGTALGRASPHNTIPPKRLQVASGGQNKPKATGEGEGDRGRGFVRPKAPVSGDPTRLRGNKRTKGKKKEVQAKVFLFSSQISPKKPEVRPTATVEKRVGVRA